MDTRETTAGADSRVRRRWPSLGEQGVLIDVRLQRLCVGAAEAAETEIHTVVDRIVVDDRALALDGGDPNVAGVRRLDWIVQVRDVDPLDDVLGDVEIQDPGALSTAAAGPRWSAIRRLRI